MVPDGTKINLASLGNVSQFGMLTEITNHFEYVRTFTTRDFLLPQATNLNVTRHCCLPGKMFRTLRVVASYTQTIIINDLQSIILR